MVGQGDGRSSTMSAQHWTEGAWLLPGFGVFQGAAADNMLHAHYAHQIVIGRQGDMEVSLTQRRIRARGIAIPANLTYCLSPADVLLIYLDPLTVDGRALFHGRSNMERLLPASLCERLLGSFPTGETMRQALRAALGRSLPLALDARLASVISALETSITAGADIDRAALAAMTDLSPSRFSHWFVDQTGLPLRSYRKWLRLVVALNHVAQRSNLTEAAHAAGFADSAHLSRTFRQPFGINPVAAVQNIALHGSAKPLSAS